jgi:hypothetical protein
MGGEPTTFLSVFGSASSVRVALRNFLWTALCRERRAGSSATDEWTSEIPAYKKGLTPAALCALNRLRTDDLCHLPPRADLMPRRFNSIAIEASVVCTENLNPDVVMMKSAQDWTTKNVSGAIDGARDRCIFLQG